MCGIAGAWSFKDSAKDDVERMTQALAHRGPDGSGIWLDPQVGIALGHRRLSIVDLSEAGRQPMISHSGRFVMSFNGEIYNHEEIRKALDRLSPHAWRGHSDTEVALAAFETWGIEDALRRFVGMFAIAIWDRDEQRLSLIRDRLGEKPLYYGLAGNTFIFGSELKALRRHHSWRGTVDRKSLSLMLRFGYVPAPYSIYEDVRKVSPSEILTFSGRCRGDLTPEASIKYWQIGQANGSRTNGSPRTDEQAVDELQELLRQAVRLQTVADVPVGAFLSGGIDSSIVVATMQLESAVPVKTFTIGFEEQTFNEAPFARAIARHLGTDHHEMVVTPADALNVIPKLPDLYDEPFSDSSQIPTYLVSSLTRRHVTVSLSGDGGDELFGGYPRYRYLARIWNATGKLPAGVRRSITGVLHQLCARSWDRVLAPFHLVTGNLAASTISGHRLLRLADMLPSRNLAEFYVSAMSHWQKPEDVVRNSGPVSLDIGAADTRFDCAAHELMWLDLHSYLPDDILVKVDRASMGVSLESRVPLLDHRIVEFAWSLPISMKLRGGTSKWILRELLRQHVPDRLINRPKMGFAIPLDRWLRGPLKDWAESLLSYDRLKREGYLEPERVREVWNDHISGQHNRQSYLWDVLMFQAWNEAAATAHA